MANDIVVHPGHLVPSLETATTALAEFVAVGDMKNVKLIRDQADLVAEYIKRRNLGIRAMQDASEIKLRAERALGEMLAKTIVRGSCNTVLPEGIQRIQSSRWQKLARVPEHAFSTYLEECRQAESEITFKAAVRLAAASAPSRPRTPKPDEPPPLILCDRCQRIAPGRGLPDCNACDNLRRERNGDTHDPDIPPGMVCCPMCRGNGYVSEKKAAAAKFIKPTIEELQAYCRERKNKVDPQKFLDYYESNGWKVGKNPMKDWRAAIRTWESNDFGGNSNGRPKTGKNHGAYDPAIHG